MFSVIWFAIEVINRRIVILYVLVVVVVVVEVALEVNCTIILVAYNRQFEFVLDDRPFLGYVYSAYRHCVLHLYAIGPLRLVSICVIV